MDSSFGRLSYFFLCRFLFILKHQLKRQAPLCKRISTLSALNHVFVEFLILDCPNTLYYYMDNWVVLWVVAFQDYTVETLSPKKKKEKKQKEKEDLQSILNEALSITAFAVTQSASLVWRCRAVTGQWAAEPAGHEREPRWAPESGQPELCSQTLFQGRKYDFPLFIKSNIV